MLAQRALVVAKGMTCQARIHNPRITPFWLSVHTPAVLSFPIIKEVVSSIVRASCC